MSFNLFLLAVISEIRINVGFAHVGMSRIDINDMY